MTPTKPRRSSFAVAFWLLPASPRAAIAALYRFCRVIDDEIDEIDATDKDGGRARLALIAAWRQAILALDRDATPNPAQPMPGMAEILALKPFIIAYGWPRQNLLDLLDGMAFDVTFFDQGGIFCEQDLHNYCQAVAIGIGELVLRCLGFAPPPPNLASYLGRAMQLTNILRDIDEDAARGRVYLPQEIWHQYGAAPPAPAGLLSHPSLPQVKAALAARAQQDFRQSLALLATHQAESPTRTARRGLRFVWLLAWLYRDILARVSQPKRGLALYWSLRKLFWLGRSLMIGLI
ncbi:MAG: squalene/phytoene synthase family protein [Candidatus Symbiobacter sp.]|nr:squalene/phytoene synthase family protein [Candidatus Symbiobacter sp.]